MITRVSYVIAKDEEEAAGHGLDTVEDAFEGLDVNHNCNCPRCYHKERKVFKIITIVCEEVKQKGTKDANI